MKQYEPKTPMDAINERLDSFAESLRTVLTETSRAAVSLVCVAAKATHDKLNELNELNETEED